MVCLGTFSRDWEELCSNYKYFQDDKVEEEVKVEQKDEVKASDVEQPIREFILFIFLCIQISFAIRI